MSVTEYATLHSKEGRGDDLAASLPKALAVIGEQPGCEGAVAHRSIERPEEFIFEIGWTSIEAHERFRESADFPRYRAFMGDALGEVTGFAHYVALVGDEGR